MDYRVKRQIALTRSRLIQSKSSIQQQFVQPPKIKTIQRPELPPRKIDVSLFQSRQRPPRKIDIVLSKSQSMQVPMKRALMERPPRPAVVLKRQRFNTPRSALAERMQRQDRTYDRYTDKIKALKNVGKDKVLVIVACGPSVAEAPLAILRSEERRVGKEC